MISFGCIAAKNILITFKILTADKNFCSFWNILIIAYKRLVLLYINHINSFIYMKFSLITKLIFPVIIIHSIGAIRILLNLTYKNTSSNSMNSSCFDHNTVTFMNFNLIKNISYRIIFYAFSDFFLA